MMKTLDELEPGMTVALLHNPDAAGWMIVDQVSHLDALTALWLHDPASPFSGEARCVVVILDSADLIVVR